MNGAAAYGLVNSDGTFARQSGIALSRTLAGGLCVFPSDINQKTAVVVATAGNAGDTVSATLSGCAANSTGPHLASILFTVTDSAGNPSTDLAFSFVIY